MMKYKCNEDEQLALIMGENINVGTKNEFHDFLVLAGGIIGAILVFILAFSAICDVAISCMPKKTQIKIEQIISNESKQLKAVNDPKYLQQVKRLETLKQRIVAKEPALVGMSSLPIFVIKEKYANALIDAGGNIYITTSMLEKDWTDEEWTFILAHEIGHYVHRDHLKAVSKKIATLIVVLATGGNNDAAKLAQGVATVEFLNHSRRQEKNADKYASRMLIKIYGNNNGAISFMQKLKDLEKVPDFVYYFSTHPSWSERLKAVKYES